MNKIFAVVNILLAVLLLVIDLSEYLSLIYIEKGYPLSILWYCHVLTYLLIYALLTKNSLVASVVLISAIPSQFMWILDFLEMIMFNGGSRTSWLFQPNITAWWIPYLSVLLHLIIIPISAYAVITFGFNKRSLAPAIILASIILILTYITTAPHANINCVFYPCDLRWPADQNIIQNNHFYFSVLYLLKEILFWSIVGSLNYIVLKKLFKKMNLKVVG